MSLTLEGPNLPNFRDKCLKIDDPWVSGKDMNFNICIPSILTCSV